MTSREYLAYVAVSVFLVVGSVVGLNLYLNDFALFGDRDNVRIWELEKTSKYLLSFNYIPNNFEGVLVGPSTSANLDTRKISGYKIYNLSMSGGNISELKYPLDNVLNHENIRYMIVCLYPYLTKNSGKKGRQIDKKEYWGSLYSLIPVVIMAKRFHAKLFPEYDPFHSSEWGYHDENLLIKNIDFKSVLRKKTRKKYKNIIIDPIAYEEMRNIIDLAHGNNIRVFAYYFPIYYEFMNGYKNSGDWGYYQGKMNSLFSKNDVIWDMNLPEYYYITRDYKSYSDGHLSYLGADRVLKDIEAKLKFADTIN